MKNPESAPKYSCRKDEVGDNPCFPSLPIITEEKQRIRTTVADSIKEHKIESTRYDNNIGEENSGCRPVRESHIYIAITTH